MKNYIVYLFLSFSVFCFSQDKQIAQVHIRGLKKTKISFVQKILDSKPGGVLDSVKLDQNIIRLKRLPGISHASYQVFLSSENTYNVFYNLEENHTIIPGINIWEGTGDQFSYKVGIYDFNFLGRGISLGGFYQNNGDDTFSLGFRAPYLFSKKLGAALHVQDWNSEEPLYFENESANYLYNNKSIELLGLYEPNLKHKFHFGVSVFNEKYQYKFGIISNQIPRELELTKMLFKLIYDYDKLEYSYQYISGFKNMITTQIVSTLDNSQKDFFIAWNDLFYFKRVSSKGNWANRIRFGLATNDNTPFASFTLDNNLNIRGVGNIIDRGSGVLLLNTEYRHTLYEKNWFILQGNTFTDIGTWRQPGGKLNDFIKSENIRVFPGVGLRFIHKRIYNAIFRIDYGYGITKNSSNGIVFGVGQYF